jgi:hypothetical protein
VQSLNAQRSDRGASEGFRDGLCTSGARRALCTRVQRVIGRGTWQGLSVHFLIFRCQID